MINANELRLKNLVLNDKSICEINHIYGMDFINCSLKTKQGNYINAHYELIEPIPLTEEWLKNAGFIKEKKEEVQFYQGYDKGNFHVFEDKGSIYYSADWWIELKSVHQLQNLFFALTNKELLFNAKKVRFGFFK